MRHPGTGPSLFRVGQVHVPHDSQAYNSGVPKMRKPNACDHGQKKHACLVLPPAPGTSASVCVCVCVAQCMTEECYYTYIS